MTSKNTSKSAANPVTPSTPVTTTATAPAPSAPVVTPLDPGAVAQCIALLTQVGTLLGPFTALSGTTIRQMLKLRKGGAQVVGELLALCTHHGLTSVGPVSVATMTTELDRATALRQIGVSLAALQKQLNDAAFLAESTTWQNATTLYTVLQRLAAMDPTLATGLAPIQAFFQTKRTKGLMRANAKEKKLKDAQKLVQGNTPPTASPPLAPVAAPATTSTNGAARS